MTDLALIPPIPHLDLGTTKRHLLLAHLCDDPKYFLYYRNRRLQGDFLILDNSAYEFHGSQGTISYLLALGYHLRAQEIVVPDTIMRERSTYSHMLDSAAFLNSTAGQYAWKRAEGPRIMVVPQVDPETQDIDDYDEHAQLLMELWHYVNPYLAGHITLGISKNMDRLEGGWPKIFEQVVTNLTANYPIKVHLLGLPHRLQMIRQLLRDYPFIRSLDTAQPFISALAQQSMQLLDAELVGRPTGYLTTTLTPEGIRLATKNIDFMYKYLISPPQVSKPRPMNDAEATKFQNASL